jgi:hypothetical protein
LILLAHHTTVPIRPLPSVAMTMDDVVLVSGPVGVKVGQGGGVGEVVSEIPRELSNGTLTPALDDGTATVLEVAEVFTDDVLVFVSAEDEDTTSEVPVEVAEETAKVGFVEEVSEVLGRLVRVPIGVLSAMSDGAVETGLEELVRPPDELLAVSVKDWGLVMEVSPALESELMLKVLLSGGGKAIEKLLQ